MSDAIDERLIVGFLAFLEREHGAVPRRFFPEPGETVGEHTDWSTRFHDHDLWRLVRDFCARPDRRAPLADDAERVEYLRWFDATKLLPLPRAGSREAGR